ncbi:MAG: 30S ribosomal protein S2 [Chloroflexi bacterium]|nr:MAG: 30S ribosomal protein S2 [Chloroflexota bacterium]MBL1196876.1 30S ribosomal protein S2 [Chloroflexota bacterium]NOH14172.1 30S ribosomal protein S2 [Chloroflexota bacterium]
MADITMKALLESGVHFGHRTHRWNPHMRPYIFTERNGIHIIDLQQTVKYLDDAYKLVRDLVADGGTMLFVGTKRQAQETIETEAQRAGMPYVTVRWLGGMLTNWKTMRERIQELDRLERMRERGDFDRLTKKEGLMLSRKIEKLETRFGGIRHMHKLPDLIFVVDVRREETAVKEANVLDIPLLALVDTNCDPRDIDHVIPSNDDAIRAIKLMVTHMADAVEEGRAMRKDDSEAAPVADSVPTQADVEGGEMEEDPLTDEELLGTATLAKMAEAAEAEEAAAAEKAAEEAAAAEEVAASEEGAEGTEETAEGEEVAESEATEATEAAAEEAEAPSEEASADEEKSEEEVKAGEEE